MTKEVKPIATSAGQICACCRRKKTCSMYMLQDCTTAWVCVECREGRNR